MPTVLRVGPYRFYFFPNEEYEPAHIHVARDNLYAKFWLEQVRLADWDGFNRNELRRIERVVREHQEELKDRWYGFFGIPRPSAP